MTVSENATPLVENVVWQPDELLPRSELEDLQTRRLQSLVSRLASRVPFYRDALAKSGVTAEDIRSPTDVRKLPFTTKADLRDHYPLGFLAVPREDVVRFHGSSGTTGRPTFVAYSRADMETWADLCARFLYAGGLRKWHTAQVAFGYGLFTGGFGLHQGIERIGAAVVPASSGNTARQLMLMQDLAVDYLICTPSYALHLVDSIRKGDVDRSTLHLKGMFLGSEPWTEDMRQRIEADLGVYVENNYGLSEVIGPGVSGECAYRTGMHIQEDHFLVECVDPDTLEPVPDGADGELVFTTLTKEAFPLIRYRTRDIATLTSKPCPCGRHSARMGRVTGRTDDMLIIRGVNVFPSQIEEALLRVEATAPHYMIEVTRPSALDEVTVHVELRPEWFSDSMAELNAISERIVSSIHGITGLHMRVDLVQPNTLARFEGKSKRVTDHRILQQG